MAIKLSDYLNNIYAENAKRSRRNEIRRKDYEQMVHIKAYDGDETKIRESMEITFSRFPNGGKEEALLDIPSKQELERKFDSKFVLMKLIAKIGLSGERVHRVTVDAMPTRDGLILWTAHSNCGSRRWSRDGYSPIMVYADDDLAKIDCDKCLGRRVKGGKDAGKPVTLYKCGKCGHTGRMGEFRGYFAYGLACPKCRSRAVDKVPGTGPQTRRVIDPNSRPRDFRFAYLADYKPMHGEATVRPDNLGVKFDKHIKAMTEGEAREKLVKQEVGPPYFNKFFSRIYDIKLTSVWSWNDKMLWSDKSGAPYVEPGSVRNPARNPVHKTFLYHGTNSPDEVMEVGGINQPSLTPKPGVAARYGDVILIARVTLSEENQRDMKRPPYYVEYTGKVLTKDIRVVAITENQDDKQATRLLPEYPGETIFNQGLALGSFLRRIDDFNPPSLIKHQNPGGNMRITEKAVTRAFEMGQIGPEEYHARIRGIASSRRIRAITGKQTRMAMSASRRNPRRGYMARKKSTKGIKNLMSLAVLGVAGYFGYKWLKKNQSTAVTQ